MHFISFYLLKNLRIISHTKHIYLYLFRRNIMSKFQIHTVETAPEAAIEALTAVK
ncbi:hypothetical protein HifGL_000971 [Haemophilus influenzae KR494]|nr:hypothetical protein HifGL_000971 [Haemophilus influenzae KR494]